MMAKSQNARSRGFEPLSPGWHPGVLPLNELRKVSPEFRLGTVVWAPDHPPHVRRGPRAPFSAFLNVQMGGLEPPASPIQTASSATDLHLVMETRGVKPLSLGCKPSALSLSYAPKNWYPVGESNPSRKVESLAS